MHQELLSIVPWKWGAENEKSLQHVICYRSGDEVRELNLEEWRSCEHLKLAHLLCLMTCFSGKLEWQVLTECLVQLGWDNRLRGEGWSRSVWSAVEGGRKEGLAIPDGLQSWV